MDKDAYIATLRKNLKGLPSEQKEDAIKEIEQHIEDSIAAGKDEAYILGRLGDFKIFAKSVTGEYYVKSNRILKAIPFMVSTGIASFLVVFVFGEMALLFGAGAVMSIFGGVLRTFGNATFNMTVFNLTVPQYLSIPAGLLTAAILLALTYICYQILKKHFIRVVNSFKKDAIF